MKKEMLINVLQPEESRIAIVEDGVLEELYVERTSHESYTGNIYKGKVVNLEPAIQAVFVDFSVGRNGFLNKSDVEPQYYQRHEDEDFGGRERPREPRRDRNEPRSARPPERGYRPALPPSPPPPPPPPSPGPPAEERDRERERPDLSERGRRDRSQPRRFGEGLTDDDDDWTPPPPPAPPLTSPEELPTSSDPAPVGSDETRSESVPFGWIDEPPPAPEERASGPFEEEPQRGRLHQPIEPIDPDLPPSRTQRSVPLPPTRPSEYSEDDLDTSWSLSDSAEVASEAEPETPPEARRTRPRGRVPRPVSEPELLFEPAAQPEEADSETDEPSSDDRAGPPRRRGGRAAIRSRGGAEREPARPPERPRSRDIEPPLEPEPQRGRAPRPRGAERGRSAEPLPPRERGRPHARAGEPGYVPRRERKPPAESLFEPDSSPPGLSDRS